MIVDSHVHLYTEEFCKMYDIECRQEYLITDALSAGINRIAVSSLGRMTYLAYPSSAEVHQANSDTVTLMRIFPDNVYGYCYLNPRNSDWLDELKRCRDFGMIGIKLWIAAKASSQLVFPIIEAAIENNLPVLQHSFLKSCGNLMDESTPYDVAELACRYPEAKIIMAHASGNQIIGIQAVQPLKNISVDISGGFPERGIIETAVEILGAERILFGTDAPGRSFAVQMAAVNAAGISSKNKSLILSENFMRLFANDN